MSIAPHATDAIIDTLNFLKSIRGDLGLSKNFSDDFLQRSARLVDAAFPDTAR